MIRQKKGKIVNISSVAGVGSSATIPHYGAAKAGVISLTKTLAVLWGKYNINVNCIAPGLIKTEIIQGALNLSDEEMTERTKSFPIQRIGLPEDIAYGAIYLASNASEYMTGQTLVIDGELLYPEPNSYFCGVPVQLTVLTYSFERHCRWEWVCWWGENLMGKSFSE